jgi:AraC-like DNA-binding protein
MPSTGPAGGKQRSGDADVMGYPARWQDHRPRITEAKPVHWELITATAASGPGFDMHYGLEFGVVLSGRMRRYYRSWRTEVRPGGVWFCGMWERHGWEIPAGDCKHLVFVIPPRLLLEAWFAEAPDVGWMAPFMVPPPRRPRVRQAKAKEVLSVAHRFEARVGAAEPYLSAFLRLFVLELLLLVVEDWRAPRRVLRRWPPEYYDAVDRAAEMALTSRQRLTVGDAAEACGMSAETFERLFTSLMGTTFSRFALRSRLSQAALQLAESDLPIASVAAAWGFHHEGHFRASFGKHYGILPSNYRRQRR